MSSIYVLEIFILIYNVAGEAAGDDKLERGAVQLIGEHKARRLFAVALNAMVRFKSYLFSYHFNYLPHSGWL